MLSRQVKLTGQHVKMGGEGHGVVNVGVAEAVKMPRET